MFVPLLPIGIRTPVVIRLKAESTRAWAFLHTCSYRNGSAVVGVKELFHNDVDVAGSAGGAYIVFTLGEMRARTWNMLSRMPATTCASMVPPACA